MQRSDDTWRSDISVVGGVEGQRIAGNRCVNGSGEVIPANSVCEVSSMDSNLVRTVIKPTEFNLRTVVFSPSRPIPIGAEFECVPYSDALCRVTGAPAIGDSIGTDADEWTLSTQYIGFMCNGRSSSTSRVLPDVTVTQNELDRSKSVVADSTYFLRLWSQIDVAGFTGMTGSASGGMWDKITPAANITDLPQGDLGVAGYNWDNNPTKSIAYKIFVDGTQSNTEEPTGVGLGLIGRDPAQTSGDPYFSLAQIFTPEDTGLITQISIYIGDPTPYANEANLILMDVVKGDNTDLKNNEGTVVLRQVISLSDAGINTWKDYTIT